MAAQVFIKLFKKNPLFISFQEEFFLGTSLVAQWLGVRLPMQGTQFWALVREDPTFLEATKPMHHNYWAYAPRACDLQQREATAISPRTATKSRPR